MYYMIDPSSSEAVSLMWQHLTLKITDILHSKQESKGLALKNRTNGSSLQQNTQRTCGTSLTTRLQREKLLTHKALNYIYSL